MAWQVQAQPEMTTARGFGISITLMVSLLGGCSDGADPLAVDAAASDSAASDAPAADAVAVDGRIVDASVDASVDATAGDGGATPQPILRYEFEGGVANSGTLGPGFAGMATSAAWVAGRHGQAIQFAVTLTSGLAILGTAAVVAARPRLTIGMWIREDQPSAPPFTHYLIDNRCCPMSTDRGFQSYHGVSGGLTTCSVGGCTTFDMTSGWHHLLYRYDAQAGARIEIFLDGNPVAIIANPTGVPILGAGVGDLKVGTRAWVTVDDLVVYEQVMTDPQQCEVVVGGVWQGTSCAVP